MSSIRWISIAFSHSRGDIIFNHKHNNIYQARKKQVKTRVHIHEWRVLSNSKLTISPLLSPVPLCVPLSAVWSIFFLICQIILSHCKISSPPHWRKQWLKWLLNSRTFSRSLSLPPSFWLCICLCLPFVVCTHTHTHYIISPMAKSLLLQQHAQRKIYYFLRFTFFVRVRFFASPCELFRPMETNMHDNCHTIG